MKGTSHETLRRTVQQRSERDTRYQQDKFLVGLFARSACAPVQVNRAPLPRDVTRKHEVRTPNALAPVGLQLRSADDKRTTLREKN